MNKISRRRVLLLFIITPLLLVIQLIIGFAVYTDIHRMRQVEAQNSKVDTYLRTNTKFISIAESAQRGYLLTGDAKYKETYASSLIDIQKNEAAFGALPADSKDTAIPTIQSASQHKLSEMTQTITLYDGGQKEEALRLIKSNIGKMMMDSIRSYSTTIRTGIKENMSKQRAREDSLFAILFLVITILIGFNIFLVYYTYNKFEEYTHRMETLITSLEDANARMLEYTNMSYHELKTPLRNIHGFAQLLKVRHMEGEEEQESESEQFIKYITDGIIQMNKTIDQMRSKYLDTAPKD